MKKPVSFIYSFSLTLTACLLILFLVSCQNKQAQVIDLTFGAGPDDSKTMMPLINDFNRRYEGQIQIKWLEASRSSNEFLKDLEEQFELESPKYDVFSSDVIWTSHFAANDWVEDLSQKVSNHFPKETFVTASRNSTIYNNRIWGVPWFTDVGVIFYRKDLLEANGFSSPPTTWGEMATMVKKIKENSDIDYGYVFQGADYEGGVTNACEFIWNAGGNFIFGDIFLSEDAEDVIIVDSKETEKGLKDARNLIESGVSPEAVTAFKELEAAEAFQRGKAIFLRGWPGSYGYLTDVVSEIDRNQIGICPIPVAASGLPSYSCLGGWNLMVNSQVSDEKKEAAWTFIKFMADAEQQLFRARNGGPMPAHNSLYEDKRLLENTPVVTEVIDIIQNARMRPHSPNYIKFSPIIGQVFNETLKGEILPESAAFELQSKFEKIVAISE